MRPLLLFLIVLFCQCKQKVVQSISGDKLLLTEILKCQEDSLCYIRKASEDFGKGNLQLFSNGVVNKGSFEEYYLVYLEKEEHINIIGGGDGMFYLLDGYNQVMIDSIKEKYGNDFFEKCMQKVMEKYNVKPSGPNTLRTLFRYYGAMTRI